MSFPYHTLTQVKIYSDLTEHSDKPIKDILSSINLHCYHLHTFTYVIVAEGTEEDILDTVSDINLSLSKHAEKGNWRTGSFVSSHLVDLTEKLRTVSECNLPISLKRWVIHALFDSFKSSTERYFSDKPTAANALTHALNVGKAKYQNALKNIEENK